MSEVQSEYVSQRDTYSDCEEALSINNRKFRKQTLYPKFGYIKGHMWPLIYPRRGTQVDGRLQI